MARRHVQDYYDSICRQVAQSQQLLEEFAKTSSENMVSPKVVENVKKTYESILENKKRVDYILFLLNMPNKKSKEQKYRGMNKKSLQGLEVDGELVENEKAMKSIKRRIKQSEGKE